MYREWIKSEESFLRIWRKRLPFGLLGIEETERVGLKQVKIEGYADRVKNPQLAGNTEASNPIPLELQVTTAVLCSDILLHTNWRYHKRL